MGSDDWEELWDVLAESDPASQAHGRHLFPAPQSQNNWSLRHFLFSGICPSIHPENILAKKKIWKTSGRPEDSESF